MSACAALYRAGGAQKLKTCRKIYEPQRFYGQNLGRKGEIKESATDSYSLGYPIKLILQSRKQDHHVLGWFLPGPSSAQMYWVRKPVSPTIRNQISTKQTSAGLSWAVSAMVVLVNKDEFTKP